MKRIVSAFTMFLFLTILSFSFVLKVKADMGPKPSTTVNIVGFDQPYYFDLLVKTNEEYVIELTEEEIFEQIEYYYYRDDFPAELNGFNDLDGFASYTLYRGIPHPIGQIDENTYISSYLTPDEFKIALVLETGEIIISDIINKTMFNANFTFDLTSFSLVDSESIIIGGITVYNVNSNLSEEIPYGQMILEIIIAVILTIAIELFILFIFRYNSKLSYILALKVNVFTQFVLNSILIFGYLFLGFFGYFFLLIIGEMVVLLLEIVFYTKFLKEKNKWLSTIYAIIANICSLVIGHYLLILIFG